MSCYEEHHNSGVPSAVTWASRQLRVLTSYPESENAAEAGLRKNMDTKVKTGWPRTWPRRHSRNTMRPLRKPSPSAALCSLLRGTGTVGLPAGTCDLSRSDPTQGQLGPTPAFQSLRWALSLPPSPAWHNRRVSKNEPPSPAKPLWSKLNL